mmetsp:Transcript_4910/g.11761  ORF Transcript_4910/g.11761 Transcript_4910/m.11761 type:complete len:214 (-) Transcript_4910:389-1030(-)
MPSDAAADGSPALLLFFFVLLFTVVVVVVVVVEVTALGSSEDGLNANGCASPRISWIGEGYRSWDTHSRNGAIMGSALICRPDDSWILSPRHRSGFEASKIALAIWASSSEMRTAVPRPPSTVQYSASRFHERTRPSVLSSDGSRGRMTHGFTTLALKTSGGAESRTGSLAFVSSLTAVWASWASWAAVARAFVAAFERWLTQRSLSCSVGRR